VAQEAGRIGTFELFPKSRTLVLSDEFCRIWGIPLARTAGLDDTLKLIHPDDLGHVLTGRAEIDQNSLGDVEYRIRRPDTGEERWIARRGEAIRNAEDDLVRFAGVVYDITDRKLAETALAAYTRNLETLNQTGAALSSVLDLDSIVQRVTDAGVDLIGAQFGAFFYNVHDESGDSLTLYTLSGANKSQFEDFGHPRATAIFKPTFDGSSNMRSDDITADARYGMMGPHFGMPQGHLPVRSYLAVPVKSRNGDVLGGLFFAHANAAMFSAAHEDLITGIASQAAIAMDNARLYRDAQIEIERRKRAEQHQQLLINELNHRVKNTLAVVQSLALQSFRGDTPSETARHDFSARLTALSAAHNLLTRQNWEQASLEDIISTSLQAAAGANMDRVLLQGPDVPLAPQTAVSVGMAIHELTTNAIKYGALSNGVGRIAVNWSVDEGSLHLEWRESGGPPVVAPKNRGFGSRMIEKGLAAELGGQVALSFPAEGVECVIDAPLGRDVRA
jgi:PAS domain S-box-containing protein